MEQLKNIESAIISVKNCATPNNRLLVINELLEGDVNYTTKEGKELLHRRALFMTALRELEIWGHPRKIRDE